MDNDDFISKTRSLTLWLGFPFFQETDVIFQLNTAGKCIAFLLNSISSKTPATGVVLVSEKPGSKQESSL